MWKHLELVATALLAAAYGVHLLAHGGNQYVASAFVLFALWMMAKLQLKECGDCILGWIQGFRRTGPP